MFGLVRFVKGLITQGATEALQDDLRSKLYRHNPELACKLGSLPFPLWVPALNDELGTDFGPNDLIADCFQAWFDRLREKDQKQWDEENKRAELRERQREEASERWAEEAFEQMEREERQRKEEWERLLSEDVP